MRFLSAIAISLVVVTQIAFAGGSSSFSCKTLLASQSLWMTYVPKLPFSQPEPAATTEARKRFVADGNEDSRLIGLPTLTGITFVEDPIHRTVRVLPTNVLDKPAQVVAMAFHGNGTTRSRATTMESIIRIITMADSTRTTKFLRNATDNDFASVSIEAVDAPGCGLGPDLKGFANVDATVDWIASMIIQKRRTAPNSPFMAFTRSSSAGLIMATAKKYPGLIDFLVMMSPTLPGHAEIIRAGTEMMFSLEKQQLFTVNRPGLAWIDKMLTSLEPWTPDYFSDMKVFILAGSRDLQVVDFEKDLYAKIAEANPGVVFKLYDADHEVTSTSGEYQKVGRQAYLDIFRFIKNVLEGRPVK